MTTIKIISRDEFENLKRLCHKLTCSRVSAKPSIYGKIFPVKEARLCPDIIAPSVLILLEEDDKWYIATYANHLIEHVKTHFPSSAKVGSVWNTLRLNLLIRMLSPQSMYGSRAFFFDAPEKCTLAPFTRMCPAESLASSLADDLELPVVVQTPPIKKRKREKEKETA